MKGIETIRLGYRPRAQFVAFHRRKERFGVVVAHRRAGKTLAAVYDLVDAALRCAKPDGRFAYVGPYYTQAKDVVWTYLKRAVAPVPGAKVHESELRVDLPNGARVRLYGADNHDRLRGIYLDGVVLDEYADMPPQAWSEVIRPALADRCGWAVFIGTPKGRNAFADMYEKAARDPEWFDLRLRASETGILAEEELVALRREMSRNEYRREMETDFDAGVEGAYFAEHLDEARLKGRVGRVAEDPLMAYRAFFDIGGTGAKADAVAIWIAQFVGREIRVLDYYEAQGQPLSAHVTWMRTRGYDGGRCSVWLPHDGSTHDKVFDVSYESALRAAGYDVTVVPNQGKGAAAARIERARQLFPLIWFNEESCAAGLGALSAYAEKRDPVRGIGLGPEHNWASHGADAFGLMCVAYEPPRTGGGEIRMPGYGAV